MTYLVLARDTNDNEVRFKIRSQAFNFEDVVKLAEKHCAKRNVKLSTII